MKHQNIMGRKELVVSALENGTVLDHIPAENVYKALDILNLKGIESQITIGINLASKIYGRKGIIKIADKFFEDEELNKLALIAPKATVNVIRGFKVVEKKTLDGDTRIVDLLFTGSSFLVTDLTAVTVNAVTDAVEEPALHAVNFNEGKIFDVFVDLHGSVADLLAQVVPEVVARSCREEVERLYDVDPVGVVDEAVERTVAAAEIEFVIRIETCKESIGIGDLCDVLENQFLTA